MFDENDRKLSKPVEDNVGKGEIAYYEQFLLFSTVFSKDLFSRHVKLGFVWERVKKQSGNPVESEKMLVTSIPLFQAVFKKAIFFQNC